MIEQNEYPAEGARIRIVRVCAEIFFLRDTSENFTRIPGKMTCVDRDDRRPLGDIRSARS